MSGRPDEWWHVGFRASHGLLATAVLVGCAMSSTDGRELLASSDIGPDGISSEIAFEVPEGARSVTVTVEGDPTAIYTLRSLVLADGVERLALASVPDVRTELLSTYPFLIGDGPARQLPRVGTFTFMYPVRADQLLPPGPATLRVASSASSGTVVIQVLVPPDDGAEVLHINLVDARGVDLAPTYLPRLGEVFAQAGIRVVVDDELTLAPRGGAWPLPAAQLEPSDEALSLIRMAREIAVTDAVNIIFADLGDADGLSAGLPGPPQPASDYYGVFVDLDREWLGDLDNAHARLIAHELAHFLGLPHVDDFGPDGEVVTDYYADTVGFDQTLMGSLDIGAPVEWASMVLTDEQVFTLRRSALLQLR